MANLDKPKIKLDPKKIVPSRLKLLLEVLRRQQQREFVGLALVELVANLVPPGGHIADVAGGDGFLARLFVEHGYRATLYDPRYAKSDVVPGPPAGVTIEPRCFHASDAAGADLIIGYHPCAATPAIARVRGRPVVLVPCCNWYYWLMGRWQGRRYGRLLLGPGARDFVFFSKG